ncbi:hypothetical protein [Candidatus Avelusimicrobium caledoniensis]|uniref:hypothetical protein n=1 Tax=Candidatus Avelusimicrobium caledoniensis TaxID=3416220 RepID=UPI003D10C2C8
MTRNTHPLAKQAFMFVSELFFTLLKMAVVVVALTVGVLVVGQSSVAPISMRLLMSYGMEYAAVTFKPYRSLFPEPYLVNIETN